MNVLISLINIDTYGYKNKISINIEIRKKVKFLKQFPFSHYLNTGDERWKNLRNFLCTTQFKFKNYVRFYFYNPKT